ncbi:SMP-30/gluconolactonase/LRE family protein [Patescibacteria group bacterium]
MKYSVILALICLVFAVPVIAEDPPQYLFSWGIQGSGDGQFDSPLDIDIDHLGNAYVADYGNHRVQKFSSTGEHLVSWGAFGAGDGEFQYTYAVSADVFGNVYVVDAWNDRVQKFTSNGTHLLTWGSTGTGPGEFDKPRAVATDDSGYVYIADFYNERIQKFDSAGVYILTFSTTPFQHPCDGLTVTPSGLVYATAVDIPTKFIAVYTTAGVYLNVFGCPGSYPTDCAMSHPNDVDVDMDGNIYVVDNDWFRVVKWSPAFSVLTLWGTLGTAPGQFDQPYGIAIGPTGWIYVCGSYNNRIQVFGPEPEIVESPPWFSHKWGVPGDSIGAFDWPRSVAIAANGDVYVTEWGNDRVQKFTSNGGFLTQWGEHGTGNGQFNNPRDVVVDGSGDVYVGDQYNNRIQKFTSDGSYLLQWGSSGNEEGQFNAPTGIAIDSNGYVYVADYYNHRIQKFTASGSFVLKWGAQGSGAGLLDLPAGVAVDNNGYVYVAEQQNRRISKFTDTGMFIRQWGSIGSRNGEFSNILDIAIDSSGDLYVTGPNGNRVQKFSSRGVFLTKWGEYGSGDGQFNELQGIAYAPDNRIYVVDSGNHRVQKFGLTVTGVKDLPVMSDLLLYSYPNPFNPTTTIRYTVPKAGKVTLAIYDVRGRLIESLVQNEFREPKQYEIQYEPAKASGVYFVRLTVGKHSTTQKIVLLK